MTYGMRVTFVFADGVECTYAAQTVPRVGEEVGLPVGKSPSPHADFRKVLRVSHVLSACMGAHKVRVYLSETSVKERA